MDSKLPHVGTTIFTVMSQLANDCGAINLSQGFPSFDPDPELLALITHYLQSGANQYAPMPGVPELRQALAEACEAEREPVEATLIAPASGAPREPASSAVRPASLDALDSTTRAPWASDAPFGRGRSRRYGVAAAVVIVLLGMAALWGGGKSAYLKLDAKSNLEGTLSLLVDGKEVYSRELHPPPKKRGLLNKMKSVVNSDGERCETLIKLSPGVHEGEARSVQGEQSCGKTHRWPGGRLLCEAVLV